MEYVKIKDHDSLIRDLDSKAILHTNMNAVDRYNQQRKIFDTAKKSADEINDLKSDINELKEMFKSLLGKLNDNKTLI